MINQSIVPFQKGYKTLVALAITILAAAIISSNFPSEAQYYKAADEGNYFRQGKLLADHGWAGFQMITDDYLQNKELQDAPNPFRIGANCLVALALTFNESYNAISCVCLIAFIIFLLGSYHFFSKHWGSNFALISLALLAFSPLEMALSKRALMDIPAMTALAFSCFAFWNWVESGRRKPYIAFILLSVASILLKEMNVIFLVFFAIAAAYFVFSGYRSLSISKVIGAIASPAIVVGGIYLITFGIEDGKRLFETMYQAVSHSRYSAVYGQGPWYRLLIDYLTLSPFTLILAVAFCSQFLFSQSKDHKMYYWLILAVFIIIVFAMLPKNVRYAVFFDLPLRLFAASAILAISNRINNQYRQLVTLGLVTLLLLIDISSFHFYFVENNIYDPISNNLLKANKIVP